MFSVAPNILLAPNMTQNAERKHRTQDANTAHFRSSDQSRKTTCSLEILCPYKNTLFKLLTKLLVSLYLQH